VLAGDMVSRGKQKDICSVKGDNAYHEQRSDDPVHDNAESYLYPDFSLSKDAVQGLELDFAQDWIHHHKQPDGYFWLVKVAGRYLGITNR
jgi:uncharacterized protein (DUF427 family)